MHREALEAAPRGLYGRCVYPNLADVVSVDVAEVVLPVANSGSYRFLLSKYLGVKDGLLVRQVRHEEKGAAPTLALCLQKFQTVRRVEWLGRCDMLLESINEDLGKGKKHEQQRKGSKLGYGKRCGHYARSSPALCRTKVQT